jgi:hypothetical protein
MTSTKFNEQAAFPAVVLYEHGDLTIYDSLDPYVVGGTADVKARKRGRFSKSIVVDSGGLRWEINGATILHGIPPFFGYRLLGRIVRVQPNVCAPPTKADLSWTKSEVLKRLRSKATVVAIVVNRLCTIIDRGEARRTGTVVETASSISEIISTLLSMDFPEKHI